MKDWSKVTLKTSDSLETAIKILHEGGLQIALVVDKKGKLLGTITDGDIRRILIKHLGMDCLVEKVMNGRPETALNSKGVMSRPIWTLMNKLTMFKDCQCGDLTNAKGLEQHFVGKLPKRDARGFLEYFADEHDITRAVTRHGAWG